MFFLLPVRSKIWEKTKIIVPSFHPNSCWTSFYHTLFGITKNPILACSNRMPPLVINRIREAFFSSPKPSKWYFSIFTICTNLWRCLLAGGGDVCWQESGPSNYPAWHNRLLSRQRAEWLGAVVRGLPCNWVHHDVVLRQAGAARTPTTTTWKSTWLIQSSASCLNQFRLTPVIWFRSPLVGASIDANLARLDSPCDM